MPADCVYMYEEERIIIFWLNMYVIGKLLTNNVGERLANG